MSFSLMPNGIYEDEQYYWFPEMQFNAFYRVDKETRVPELLFHFPNEALETERLYTQPVKVGDWFVFSPISAKSLFLYNVLTGEQKNIPLKPVSETKKIEYIEGLKFSVPVVRGDIVYFFPLTYPAILKLDLNTMKVYYLTTWVKQLEKQIVQHQSTQTILYFNGRYLNDVDSRKVLFTCGGSAVVFEFDFNLETGIVHNLQGDVAVFQRIIYDGSNYWLTPSIGNLLTKWNKETGEITTFPIIDQWNHPWPIVGVSFKYNEGIYMLTTKDSHCYRLNLKEERIEQLGFLEPVIQQEKTDQVIYYTYDIFSNMVEKEHLCFVSARDFRWYTINLETEEVTSFALEVDESAQSIISDQIAPYKYECIARGISEFVNFLDERISKEHIVVKRSDTIGDTILEATTTSK
ncbi:MAG: hypothetical protein R3Y07_00260 [Eubacteriales bacterium]